MRACLYIGYHGNEWIWDMFPGRSPGELPLAGKSWTRHAIDICSQLEAREAFVADAFFHDDLQQRLGDGSYWSFDKLQAFKCETVSSPRELIAKHAELRSDEDLLFFWGQVLPDVADVDGILRELLPVEENGDGDALPDGIYLLRDGVLNRCDVPLLRMDTIKNYFELNLRLLKAPGIYNLPGYSSEQGFGIGQNVIMMPNCRIDLPVIILDDSYLGRSVRLAGEVVIGKNVLIENYSVIKRSVIFDNTFIGRSTEFVDKIVCGNRIIDAFSGAYVDVEDAFLAGNSRFRRFDRYRIGEFVIALALTIGLAPLYLLARPFKKRLDALPFFRLLLRSYPKCLPVLAGKADLIRSGVSDREWAFRFADQWVVQHDEHYKDMADVYFRQHRSLRLVLSVVIQSFVKRLFVLNELTSGETPKRKSVSEK